jgi:hypothetical protein
MPDKIPQNSERVHPDESVENSRSSNPRPVDPRLVDYGFYKKIAARGQQYRLLGDLVGRL